jgi:diguanylate cyclase (GGDEF)-like protein
MIDFDLSNISVLYVEDEDPIRESLSRFLKRRVGTLYEASNGEEGLKLFNEIRPDIVITDVQMPVMNGLTMAEEMKKIDEDIPIIITTAFNDEEYFLKAIDIGVDKYIKKPINNKVLLGSIVKISQLILSQKQLDEKNKFIEDILGESPNFITIIEGNEITYFNRSFMNFFNVASLEEFKLHHDVIDDFILKKSGNQEKKFSEWIRDIGENEEPIVYMTDEKELKMDAGSYMVKIKKMPDRGRYLVIFTDITVLENERRKYQELSIKDPLTNIFNRNKFNDMLKDEMERADRFNNTFALIMFDIDYFKKVNDTYGHQVGDYVLKDISALVLENVRHLDVFARYGGEEFILLLPETRLEGAIDVAEKLRHVIENRDFEIIGSLTCSFGAVEYRKNEGEHAVIKRVDDMLYKAKSNGRNKVEAEA